MSPFTTVYQLWYIREASVAVFVGNLLCTWQLLQRVFKLRSFDNKDAGIRKVEGASPAEPDAPTRYTIGGTPYLAGGTPNPNGLRNLWGRRRDPDSSLFDTILSSFRGTNHNATAAADEVERGRSMLPVVNEISTATSQGTSHAPSDAYVNERHPGAGIDIFSPTSSPRIVQSPS